MPINMLLTLFASFCMSHTILLHGWAIIPSSSSHMTPTNAFVKLYHDACTLIPTYDSEDRVGITMTKQLSIYEGILLRIPLNRLCLCRFYREQTIS